MVDCQTNRDHQKRHLAKIYDEAVVDIAGGGGRTVVAALCQWWVHSERAVYEYFLADLTAMILGVVQRTRVDRKTAEAVAREVVEYLEDIDLCDTFVRHFELEEEVQPISQR